MTSKHYPMNRKLYDAVAEDSDWSVIEPFLLNLTEALVKAGFDARIIYQEGRHYFWVDDEIREELTGNTSGAIWALLDMLAKKDVSVQLHPKFGLLVEGEEEDRHAARWARRQNELAGGDIEEMYQPEIVIVEEMLTISKVDDSVQ